MTNIDVIVDASGSMAEWGKAELTEYVLHSIRNFVLTKQYSRFTFNYYLWKDSSVKLFEEERIMPCGKSDIECLISFISESKNKTLFLTDGSFRITRRNIAAGLPIVSIAIGCDHNVSTIKPFSHTVYKADNLISAINDLCYGGI